MNLCLNWLPMTQFYVGQMSTYSSMDGVLYCKPHFEQLFKESGNFSKNFQTGKMKTVFWFSSLSSIFVQSESQVICTFHFLLIWLTSFVVFMIINAAAKSSDKQNDLVYSLSYLSICITILSCP